MTKVKAKLDTIMNRPCKAAPTTEAQTLMHEVETVGDAMATTIALLLLGAAAVSAEHALHINGDVAFSVITASGAHPLASMIRRIL